MDSQGNLTSSFGVSKKLDKHNTLIDLHKKRNLIKPEDMVVQLSDTLHLIPSSTKMELIDGSLTLDNVPLDKFLQNLLKPIINNYEVIIFDCPPRLSPVTTSINLFVDTILIPTDLDEFSIDGIETMFTNMSSISSLYGEENIKASPLIFISKFDSREKVSFEFMNELKEKYGDFILSSYIPRASLVKNSFKKHKMIWENPKNHPYFSDFIELFKEVMDKNGSWNHKTKH